MFTDHNKIPRIVSQYLKYKKKKASRLFMLYISYEMKCSEMGWSGAFGNWNGFKPNEREVKCSEVYLGEVEMEVKWSGVMVIVTRFLSLLEDI